MRCVKDGMECGTTGLRAATAATAAAKANPPMRIRTERDLFTIVL